MEPLQHQKNDSSRSSFIRWNDRMAQTHDVQEFLENSFFLIRYVENKRIRLVLEFLGEQPRHKVLEMGCGPGFILRQVHSGARFGIDLALGSLKKGAELFGQDKMKFAAANTEALPFRDATFDRVICTEVIEHVQNPPLLLQELMRVLKPEGKAVLTVPNDRLVSRLKNIFAVLRLDRLLEIKYGGADEWHLHTFTMKELRRTFREMGLRVEKTGCTPSRALQMRWVFLLSKEN